MATSETALADVVPSTTPCGTAPFTTPLRGRQAERDVIDAHLRGTKAGRGAVLLVEGGAGLGKSRMLDEAVTCAAVDGFRVGTAMASPLDRPIAMAPLLTALFDGAEPVLARTAIDGAVEPTFCTVMRLAAALEVAARRQPLLLCIDELHAVDDETAAALGILTQRLLGLPVLWVLAVRPRVATRAVADLVVLLERHGAVTLTLEPLDEAAGTCLTADLLVAEPSAALQDLVGLTAGVPAIIVDLVHGLLDEGLARVDDGVAELVAAQIPRRLRDRVRAAMAHTSPHAREVAIVGAVQGTPMALDRVAAMLAVTPAALLGPIEELVRIDVLVDEGGSLAFRSELDRRAVTDLVAPSVIRALRLQAIDVLLAAGASPLQPARELAATRCPHDRTAVATLRAASHAVSSINLDLAAQLCRRAFDATVAGDDGRAALASDLATFLHDGGRQEQAKAIVDAVTREVLAPDDDAMLRLTVARMGDLTPRVRIEAGQAVMARPGLSSRWHVAHTAELILNHLDDGRADAATALLAEVAATVESGGNEHTSGVITLARARLAALDGELERVAAGLAPVGPTLATATRPARAGGLFRAELLLARGEHEELQPLVSSAIDLAERVGHEADARSWRRLNARLLMQRGCLTEAATVLAVELEGELDAARPDDARDLLTRYELAVHTGDDRRRRTLAAIAGQASEGEGPASRRLTTWLLARHAETKNDRVAALDLLARLGPERDTARLPMLTVEPLTAPRLVHIAQWAELGSLAVAVATTAMDLAVRNPSTLTVEAVAAHCVGLVEHDPDALAAAAEKFGRASLPLAEASALEDLGVALADGPSGGAAVEAFDAALRRYAQCGAGWDASRVRRRLRERGVRRRLVTPTRAANGWSSLTIAELAVVRLVADGLTNRAVAGQLFVSSHTVSMHLRHVFLKLGINSRVELARLAVDHEIT